MKAVDFVDDFDDLAQAKLVLDDVCRVDQGLPHQVFLKDWQYYFAPFDDLLSERFWLQVQLLCQETADSHVLFCVLEPNPVEYFKKKLGWFGWFNISCKSLGDNYWDAINAAPSDSPHENLYILTEKIAVTALSRRWAVWGERCREICILGCERGIKISEFWEDFNWAMKEALPFSFVDRRVPDDFGRHFRSSYERSTAGLE